MSLTPEQIFHHLHAIHEGEAGWQASREALLTAGSEAVPYMVEVLEIEVNKAHGSVVVSVNKLLRLTEVLADFDDPRVLWPLLRLARQVYKVYSHFRKALEAVETRASPDDIQALLELLTRARPRWTGTTLILEVQAMEGLWIATALVNIAERDPKPELRAALPLLTPHPFLPLEFIGLRKRLKAALASEALPIPAMAAQTTENLPLPAEEKPLAE